MSSVISDGEGTIPSGGSPETPASAGDNGLRKNSLKLWHVCAMGIAYQGLALAIYNNLGLITGDTGPIAPLIFIGVSIAAIPTAISFAVLSNRIPSAGSASTWATQLVAPTFGVWMGFIMAALYTISSCLFPLLMGIFVNSLLEFFGVHATWVTAVLGGLIAITFIGYTTIRNVKISARVTATLTAFEVLFVAFLSIFIVIKQGSAGHLSLQPFNPAANTGGFNGVRMALIFVVLSISGFDVVVPLAEEARTPRRYIPTAVLVSLIGAGLYMSLTSYGYVMGVSPAHLVSFFNGTGQVTPIYPLAGRYIGDFRILVPITGITATLAGFGAVSVAASRILYTLSHDGHGPRTFGSLHARYRTPWNAQRAVLAATIVVPLLVLLWQDRIPTQAYGWLGSTSVFFILIPYTLVNVFNIIYHLRRRREMNWFLHLVLPVLGIVFNVYVFYEAFFKASLTGGLPFKSGASIVVLPCVLAFVIGVPWAVRSMSRARRADARPTVNL